jgi:hypothetical protein
MVRLNAPKSGDRALIFSERTVTEASYLGMLVPYTLPHSPHGIVFQQDRAPRH